MMTTGAVGSPEFPQGKFFLFKKDLAYYDYLIKYSSIADPRNINLVMVAI